MAGSLFPDDAPNAIRQPKTDRLILTRYMREAVKLPEVARDKHAEEAHAILIKWADLESSGQLARMNENQLQGEFLADIFGRALGYRLFSEGEGEWSLEQHHTVGGQQPDAILGNFKAGQPRKPLAVIELKGPRAHLDRDRSNGRTAVQQCWEYLVNTERDCRWGIVSNMVSFRLYERDSTQRRYEHFSLQSLRDVNTFRQFYCLFHRKGLIEKTAGHAPRAAGLLEKSNTRQRQVGDELYDRYSQHRTLLIDHLHKEQGFSVPDAIEIVQRLLDRVIFIAFCEDRGLLNQHTIKRAYEQVQAFYNVTNPRWQNFKNLFRFLDKGKPELDLPAYNGGLFAESPADDIELDDNWTIFFNTLGSYDFADEVNLDVLGHLFEKSITELEKQRASGLFEGKSDQAREYAQMPQSAKRKRLGIYYTPQELTSRIVGYTVDELITERLAALAKDFLPSPPGRGAGGEGESKSKQPLDSQLRDFARKLRADQTDAEALMWGLLRNRRLGGFKFRRQHPIALTPHPSPKGRGELKRPSSTNPPSPSGRGAGGEGRFILDFYCHEAGLAIELDGGQHNEAEARARDERRTARLAAEGIRVIRFWDHDVLKDTEAVLEAIWNELNALTPNPSPGGRGGPDRPAADDPQDSPEYWRQAVATIRNLKIVDPACGSGAFLFQAYEVLEHRYMEAIGHLEALGDPAAAEHAQRVPEYILNDNLYGVDLSPEAVEIAQLALWIRSATPGRTLATLSHNIVHGNSLVHDPEVHPAGFDWQERFPEVFERDLPSPPGRGAGGEGESEATGGSALTPNPSPLTPLPEGEGDSIV